ncbi:nucleotidyltransferase domain-containing protein [Amycolatopsis albispora]|uniref:Polymerase nucleotidyl transferase domain-containing protein n=1 Tax=Amycolatopsis albispora TaxID=1804986 RepID=A0A344LK77_9PSEU|nr:nucleotidyltransferase domain-containing protein [Amycolatopsis albispora]AXB48451.1 hypothetical protein A4R43_13190 [Amycolatopsis albispora]
MTAEAVAAESARAFQEAFGDRLTAVYLLGSLAYGGFSPAVSDIDLALVLADSRDGDRETVDAVSEELRGRGGMYGKLSVFWASLGALSEGRDDGRFPALDRLQLADRSRLLTGVSVESKVARPEAAELALESARFAVGVLATDEVVAEFHQPRRLLSDAVWFTKAVLFPVRFLYSAMESGGRAATNDEAIEWYLARQGAPGKSLVGVAAGVRAGEPLAVGAEIAPELRELYRYYLDEVMARVEDADLVAAYGRWREKLS